MTADAQWSALSSRVVRVVMTRKDVAYDFVALRLADVGIKETKSGLASRLSRGRISLVLFLQILRISKAKVPPLWAAALQNGEDWERSATRIVELELSRRPMVTMDEMVRRVVELGAGPAGRTLATYIFQGTISLASFLQCLVVLGSESLELYIDFEDMVALVSPMPEV
ncbi:DUF6471 domain-containing protein [Herbaspirillum sp. WKF16]|uniref:DUF6471 domain-containing protein n=1 Tax=Herbaspirillum sp. WKF16 TaxID=3028312 RepID=UPI0023A93DB7|nr:DUF6471 domain-containing protein [Herbaspirillum sp. WKF16]WDZ95753.1 DUF6471 domain-containing protein [Herbaspirillum sp. WKF16]